MIEPRTEQKKLPKFNLDDILNELGVHEGKQKPQLEGASDAPAPARPHRVDRAEEAFSPLPPMPANQKRFGTAPPTTPDADPAVKVKPESVEPAVGPALAPVYTPDAQAAASGDSRDLGEVLLQRSVITPDRLQVARQVIRQSPGRRLEDVVVEQGADEAAVLACVAHVAGIPFERVDLGKGLDGGFDGKLLQRLGVDFCKTHSVLPLRTEGRRVVVGACRADDVFLVDEVRQRLGVTSVKLVLVPAADIRAAMELVGAQVPESTDLSEILAEVTEGDVQVEKEKQQQIDLEKEAGEGPVIRYVNYLIQQAVKEGASDIHIEPSEKKVKIRFRIDGELCEMMNPPASMAAAVISRIKIMANLDIAERRIPQDGRIRCQVAGRKLDLRVSTLPTAISEKIVMRILDTRSINVELDQLGFDDDTLDVWKRQIDSPHGIILVTGPTGSGKTTTLYASLRVLDKNSMNISTVEDPVEYHLDGITQTQIHEKIGMTFSVALRALLRQDPDVIMVGEIRDGETAQIAVQAALTGHLVLSTLHTNDAPSSITRLVNIGLEPFLVGAAVNAVLAQRLIRRLCKECRAMERPGEEMAEFLTLQGIPAETVWMAKGCDKCRKTGYSGRLGIYELLTVDDALRDIIARNPNVAEFRRTCLERGMVTLRQDGLRKVQKGLTTVHEVLRVTEAH